MVVCPTTALRAQWAEAADAVGLHLDPRWRNAEGAWRGDVDGVVVTYQQVASAPDCSRTTSPGPRSWCSTRSITRASPRPGARRCALPSTARAPARALGHAVSLRRARDPVRPLRRGAPLRARLRLRLRRGGPRRRLPPARLPAARRDPALARRRAGDDRGVRRRTRPDRRRPPPADRDRPDHAAAAGDAPRRRRLLVKARAVIPDAAGLVLCDDRAHARATGRAAAHDRRREAGRGGERRAAGAHADRPLRARRRERPALARRREHGQRGRRRAPVDPRRLRDGQAHRPLLPPSGRPRRPAARAATPPTSSRPSSSPPTRR